MSRSWLEGRFGVATLRLGRNDVRIEPRRGAGPDVALIEAVDAAAGRGQPPWQASLEALDRLLAAASGKSLPTRIRLVVSNEFVRYALAPWTPERLTEKEREQLVRALLADRYGERENTWHLAIEPQRFGEPALAAAVDADLVAAAQGLATRNGYRLQSMVPALIDKLNTHRRRLGKIKGGWLVDASDGRLASLAFLGGAWAQVTNERHAGASTALKETLLPLLRRDSLRRPGLLGGTVYLAHGGNVPGLIDQTWPVIRLGEPQPCA